MVKSPKAIIPGTTNRSFAFIRFVPSFVLAGGHSKCMRLTNAAERIETDCKSSGLRHVRREKEKLLGRRKNGT
jgi:hypothetical protein